MAQIKLTLAQVNDVLWEYDYAGVAMYGASSDEYMTEAKDIFDAILTYDEAYHVPMPIDVLATTIQSVFARWFLPLEPPSVEEATWMATEIVAQM